jgi:AAHS family 3-hydroxyphenylpropionic acid transporter
MASRQSRRQRKRRRRARALPQLRVPQAAPTHMTHDERNAQAARTTIVFCVLAALCEGFDLQAAGVAVAGISPEFRPGPEKLGTFFSASTVGLFIGALVGGRLADSIGRKTVMVASIGVFGLFSLLTAFAGSMPELNWARLLTGLGLGGALPNLVTLVSESARPNRHSASIALVYSGNPFGGTIASIVSLVISPTHWRWIFIVGGVAPLLLVPVMALVLPESAAFRRVHGESRSIAEDVVSMPRRGSFSAILSEGRAPRTLLLWVSFFLGLLSLYLLINWLPTLLMSDGLTHSQAAGAQIGFNIGGGLAALLIGHLLEGNLRRGSVTVTFIAVPLLMAALAKCPPQPALMISVVFLLGCAIVAAQAFLYAMAPPSYPTSIRGVGVGAAVAAGRIGSIVGPKLGGALRAAGHGGAQLFLDILPLVIVGSICGLLLARYMPKVMRPEAIK